VDGLQKMQHKHKPYYILRKTIVISDDVCIVRSACRLLSEE
jgi:hypothetical protein